MCVCGFVVGAHRASFLFLFFFFGVSYSSLCALLTRATSEQLDEIAVIHANIISEPKCNLVFRHNISFALKIFDCDRSSPLSCSEMGNTTRISYKPNKFSLENLNNNKLTYRFNKSNDDTLLH